MSRIVDLNVYNNSQQNYSLTITENGEPVDLFRSRIYMTVKEKPADAYSDAVIKKVVVQHYDPTNGKTIVSITLAEISSLSENSYYYDIVLVDAQNRPTLLAIGKFNVNKGITDEFPICTTTTTTTTTTTSSTTTTTVP